MTFSKLKFIIFNNVIFLPLFFTAIYHFMQLLFGIYYYTFPEFHIVIGANFFFLLLYGGIFLFYEKFSDTALSSILIIFISIYTVLETFYFKATNNSEVLLLALLPSVFFFNFEKTNSKCYYFVIFTVVLSALAYHTYINLRWTENAAGISFELKRYFIFRRFLSSFSAISLLFYNGTRTLIIVSHNKHRSKRLRDSLEFTAHHDTLTGLMNRIRTNKIFQKLTSDKKQSGKEFAIAMFDIDNFKKINDIYGHDAGDLVLKTYSKRVWDKYGEPVKIGRWGGEEFVILFPYLNDKLIYELDYFREKISTEPVIFNGIPIPVTATYGLASSKNFQTAEEVLNEADKALYEGKNHGKNRLVVSSLY